MIISFNFLNSPKVRDCCPSLLTLQDFSNPQGGRHKALDGLGKARFHAIMEECRNKPEIRMVEGIFKFRDMCLWVLVRLRVRIVDGVEKPELATVLNGISYLGLDNGDGNPWAYPK